MPEREGHAAAPRRDREVGREPPDAGIRHGESEALAEPIRNVTRGRKDSLNDLLAKKSEW